MRAGEIRALLDRRGLVARRDLGQNFLIDDSLAARLVQKARVAPGDSVIEIGAGLGVLTRALAGRALRVVAVEVDAGIVRALREEHLLPEGVKLHHADVLRMDLPGLVAALPAPVRVVANLPYSISTPVLRILLDLRHQLTGWSVMVQREVAERLLAGPGSKAYGSLSVLHHLALRIEKGMDLSPRCFHPAPRVHSTFLGLEPRPDSRLTDSELPWVERFVRAAFSKRRKTLVNAVRSGALGTIPPVDCLLEALAAEGLDARIRADAVSPDGFLALARRLAPSAAEGR